MRFGQPVVTAQTIAGPLNWEIDSLTSQEFLLGNYETYMQQAFAKFVRPGATVYDVGSHSGYHSLLCALLVGKTGRVIAFEPVPTNRTSIQRQVLANPDLSVTLSPFALSDRNGSSAFDVSHGSGQGRVAEGGKLRVEIRRLDDLVAAEGFSDPDVIKIDVEGHEEQLLKGALATIDRSKPVVLCDINDHSTFGVVRDLLGDRGYLVTDGWPIIAVPQLIK
jgi:FkbM family methyltransferase